MSLKFTAGFNKKLGLADHGSLGASCQLELVLDQSFSNDPDGIQRAVEQAFAACRLGVEEELARQLANNALTPGKSQFELNGL